MRKMFLALASLLVVLMVAPLHGAVAQATSATGQVMKIDESAGKITLKHEPIKNLDMDSMTMVFRIKDPALLKAVKVGDKVKFEAERVEGALTVTKIEKAK